MTDNPDWSEVVHSHRIGQFSMSAFLLRVNPQGVADLMRNVIITHAQLNDGDRIDYDAFSPMFDATEAMAMLRPPRYSAICTDGVWAFVRQA